MLAWVFKYESILIQTYLVLVSDHFIPSIQFFYHRDASPKLNKKCRKICEKSIGTSRKKMSNSHVSQYQGNSGVFPPLVQE